MDCSQFGFSFFFSLSDLRRVGVDVPRSFLFPVTVVGVGRVRVGVAVVRLGVTVVGETEVDGVVVGNGVGRCGVNSKFRRCGAEIQPERFAENSKDEGDPSKLGTGNNGYEMDGVET